MQELKPLLRQRFSACDRFFHAATVGKASSQVARHQNQANAAQSKRSKRVRLRLKATHFGNTHCGRTQWQV